MQSNNDQQSPHEEFSRAAKGRILSFDLARGFTILIMPAIHTVMLCSASEVQQSLLGAVLTFIAEGPGAQLFMLLMGVHFALKHSSREKESSCLTGVNGAAQTKGIAPPLKRSLYLLLAAYTLNLFKFILPLGLGVMPENLLTELQLTGSIDAAIFFFSIGDILHFAAIANLLLFLFTRTRHYALLASGTAITIVFLSPYLWDLKTGIIMLDYILGLFNGRPPQTFFPVFPWLIYPVIGLVLGNALKRFDTDLVLKRSGIIGAIMLVVSLGLPATPVTTDYLSFYRTYPADTIFHIGVVLLWLQLWQWLSKLSPFRGNWWGRLLIFCSKNITSIYFIQWILICLLMCYTGYLTQSMFMTWIWMIAVTTVTLLITFKLTQKL